MLMESVSTISFSDQRTTNWFMMSSPFPTLFICLSYVYGVKVLGPKLMENRKPFQLKNVLIVYNLFQMVFSAWLFYEVRFLLRPFLPPSLPPSLLSFLSSIFTLFSIYLLYWILLTSYESFFSILKCVACFEMPLVYKHVMNKILLVYRNVRRGIMKWRFHVLYHEWFLQEHRMSGFDHRVRNHAWSMASI